MFSSDLKMFCEFDVRTDWGGEFYSGTVRGCKERAFVTIFIGTEVLVGQRRGSAE